MNALNTLPEGFVDLEPLVAEWSLARESDRNRKRIGSPMPALQAFYDAVVPRLADILDHLGQFEMATLPPAEARLMNLALSLMEVAPAVELFKTPDVPDSIRWQALEILET